MRAAVSRGRAKIFSLRVIGKSTLSTQMVVVQSPGNLVNTPKAFQKD